MEGAPGVSAERLASYRKLLGELEELEAERRPDQRPSETCES